MENYNVCIIWPVCVCALTAHDMGGDNTTVNQNEAEFLSRGRPQLSLRHLTKHSCD